MQGDADDFGGIDDAGFDQVFIDAGAGVVADVDAFGSEDFGDDNGAVHATVFGDLFGRGFEGAQDDLGAEFAVAFERGGQLGNGFLGAQEGDAAAGDDAFFNGCATSGVQGVFDAGSLFASPVHSSRVRWLRRH